MESGRELCRAAEVWISVGKLKVRVCLGPSRVFIAVGESHANLSRGNVLWRNAPSHELRHKWRQRSLLLRGQVLEAFELAITTRRATGTDELLVKLPIGRQVVAGEFLTSLDVPKRPEEYTLPVHIRVWSAGMIK
jgi:hypothetical protein